MFKLLAADHSPAAPASIGPLDDLPENYLTDHLEQGGRIQTKWCYSSINHMKHNMFTCFQNKQWENKNSFIDMAPKLAMAGGVSSLWLVLVPQLVYMILLLLLLPARRNGEALESWD